MAKPVQTGISHTLPFGKLGPLAALVECPE